jgi:hypothetical protein
VLHQHLGEIQVSPRNGGESWHYIAGGGWDLLGTNSNLELRQTIFEGRFDMVAGVGFEPTTFGL